MLRMQRARSLERCMRLHDQTAAPIDCVRPFVAKSSARREHCATCISVEPNPNIGLAERPPHKENHHCEKCNGRTAPDLGPKGKLEGQQRGVVAAYSARPRASDHEVAGSSPRRALLLCVAGAGPGFRVLRCTVCHGPLALGVLHRKYLR